MDKKLFGLWFSFFVKLILSLSLNQVRDIKNFKKIIIEFTSNRKKKEYNVLDNNIRNIKIDKFNKENTYSYLITACFKFNGINIAIKYKFIFSRHITK